MMFDYEKLFEPYSADGSSLELTINWLKKTTKCEEIVIDQVINETMQKLSHGEDFTGNCECGCGLKNAHTKINHYMLARTYDFMSKVEAAKIKVLQETEKTRLEARQKQLVDSEKQLFEAYHGNFWQRNLPTFRRWLRFKD